MTRYQSTPSKRIRTTVRLLMVAMTAAVIVAIIACSGEQPPPTHRPQTENRSPIQTIEALAAEIAALQTKAAQPGETAEDDREEPGEPPARRSELQRRKPPRYQHQQRPSYRLQQALTFAGEARPCRKKY